MKASQQSKLTVSHRSKSYLCVVKQTLRQVARSEQSKIHHDSTQLQIFVLWHALL